MKRNPDRTVQRVAAGVLLAVTLFAGCDLLRRDPPPDAIAVVGNDWLTRETAVRELHAMGVDSVDEAAIARYVNRWIDRKLLLNEARDLHLDGDPETARRLDELEAEFLISELLARSTTVDTPSARQIVEYWKNHTGEYTRVTDEVSLVIARVTSKNRAWRLREGFDQSLSEQQMREEIGVTRIDTLRNIAVERVPGEIAEAIEPLKSGQASLPIQYHDDWMIVKVLDRFRAGRARPVEEVESLVIARMMAEERSRRKFEFIEALRREARQSGFVRIRIAEARAETTGAVPDTAAPRATRGN